MPVYFNPEPQRPIQFIRPASVSFLHRFGLRNDQIARLERLRATRESSGARFLTRTEKHWLFLRYLVKDGVFYDDQKAG